MELWNQVTNLDPARRASAVILHIDAVAQEVCMAAEGDVIMDQEAVEKIMELLRDHFAPGTVDSVN